MGVFDGGPRRQDNEFARAHIERSTRAVREESQNQFHQCLPVGVLDCENLQPQWLFLLALYAAFATRPLVPPDVEVTPSLAVLCSVGKHRAHPLAQAPAAVFRAFVSASLVAALSFQGRADLAPLIEQPLEDVPSIRRAFGREILFAQPFDFVVEFLELPPEVAT